MSQPDEIDAQLQLIAKMLVEARAPLIYGLTRLTVEAQELAVELAMCLRGAIDTPRGSRIPPRGTSLQLHGEARTTQGELRQYADLLVVVGVELTNELRVLFAVNGSATLTQKQLLEIKVPAGEEPNLETRVHELGCRNMDEVHALRKKLKVPASSNSSHELLLTAWQAAKYPVLVYEPAKLLRALGKQAGGYYIEQLERTVLDRAKNGRAAAWPLEEASNQLSNATGAEYVLTARTGCPAAVCYFSGSAEYLPGVTNAEALLVDGVIDAALFLGEGPCTDWSAAARQHLQKIPTAIIASKETLEGQASKHQITSSALSEEVGTIVREDGIPVPLAAKVAPVASAEMMLQQLLALVRKPALAETGAAR